MRFPYDAAMKRDYETLFAQAAIYTDHLPEIDIVVDHIAAPRAWARYQKVQAATGVPAHVIGIIHQREASGRFDWHLHNGDPLSARTYHEPPGRPPTGGPPFTWEVSATDALTMPGQEL